MSLPNATRRWMRRRAERRVDAGKNRGNRPGHGSDPSFKPALPRPTRWMVRLGVDRASCAQGGRVR